MRWTNKRRSDNVEDRRGKGASTALKGGGLVLIAAVVMLLLGRDPSGLLQMMGGEGGSTEPYVATAHEDSLAEMSSVVLASTEDVWTDLFRQQGMTYSRPKLVLFTGSVQSACGYAQSAMGPFYCSGDSKVYLDLSFFDELGNRFGASGDFAQAYVIAHEVGHHVQNLVGVLGEVHRQKQQLGEKEANRLTVRLELQADFYAGVWAHYADRAARLLERGDLEEALNAASQIGDDILQKRSHGRVVPDAFTHGSSEQRLRWFRAGFESGDWTRAAELFELPYERL